MNGRLKSLYQSVILKHNKDPYHFVPDENADHVLVSNNPLCGDKFHFYIYGDDERLGKITFHGFGCAISKASNSILAQSLENLTVAEAKKCCEDFLHFIESGSALHAEVPETFEAFAAVKEFPGRKDCACLGWENMSAFLSEWSKRKL